MTVTQFFHKIKGNNSHKIHLISEETKEYIESITTLEELRKSPNQYKKVKTIDVDWETRFYILSIK